MGLGTFYNHYISYCKDHDSCVCYTVPYCKLIEEINAGVDSATFSQKWLECFKSATEEFDSAHKSLWNTIMFETQKHPEFIGALPDDALIFYIENRDEESTTELLAKFQDLQNSAMINSEALHHLISNFDERYLEKGNGNDILMTSSLMPHLITSSLNMAAPRLVSIVNLLQGSLESEEDFLETLKGDESLKGDIVYEKSHDVARAEELRWFFDNAAKLDYMDKVCLVGHRGFHNVSDRSDNRPVENTLTSFEQVWAADISVCECDVALTKDGKIVMAHDENFTRLALLADCKSSVNKVSDLTLRQIFSLPLKGGTRPPLLSDVLRSAAAIGDHCKLVIEIKPGNTEICVPLIRLFARNPGLLKYVAVIMSFDSYIMSELSIQMADLRDMLNANSVTSIPTVRRPTMGKRVSMIHSAYSPEMPSFNSFQLPKNTLLASLLNFDSITESAYETPKLILVTNSEPTPAKFDTSVKTSFSNLDELLTRLGLDGVYLEFEDEMLEPEGIEAMRALAKKMDVGMWMDAAKHPDKLSICRHLMNQCDVSWINTDFPPDFFES